MALAVTETVARTETGWTEPVNSPRMQRISGASLEKAETGHWRRKPDEVKWHSTRGPELGMRVPICGAPVWLRTAGEAQLPLATGATFGPVCEHCTKLEGYGDAAGSYGPN